MEKNVRYLWNWGLAFDETRILKKFEGLAEKGWFLEGMTTLRYRLRKGESKRLRYAMDYRKLEGEEKDEYLSLFAENGWEHVCDLQGFYFFCAPPEAVAIHTEPATEKEKYSGYRKGSFLAMTLSAVCFAGLLSLNRVDAMSFLGQAETWVMAILLAACAAVFAPALMMTVAYWLRMRKIGSEG